MHSIFYALFAPLLSHVFAVALPAPSATSSATSSASTHPLTPNGIKAGSAGGNLVPFVIDHIGWWYDWSPTPTPTGSPVAVPMLWGSGTTSDEDASRLQGFKELTSTPGYVLGFEEPDCPSGGGSSGYIAPEDGAQLWDELIAPWGAKDTLLGSPSMCKQADENWLTPFNESVTTTWDFTAIHINKLDKAGIQKDIVGTGDDITVFGILIWLQDHYWNTYQKPIWVTEFACVDGDYQIVISWSLLTDIDQNGFTPCESQDQINTYINDAVDLFEANEHIFAYGYSDGLGLGDSWPPVKNGELTESGQTYLAKISTYH
ncbi:MAG: hypothetical protein MMC23_009583 [Stictis urceolatum]|nr:hypothetical protein [Stictis urceolata]